MTMSTKINDTLIGIIYLPKRFNELGNASIDFLLRETGYFNIHNQISESLLQEKLHHHPDCVKDWLHFSEDKRSGAGWYFRQDGAIYEVGYFPSEKGEFTPTKYDDSIQACAVFVKHEIESIRMSRTTSDI
jgi:hypothetical protein